MEWGEPGRTGWGCEKKAGKPYGSNRERENAAAWQGRVAAGFRFLIKSDRDMALARLDALNR